MAKSKLGAILEQKNMTQGELYDAIARVTKVPVAKYKISRIVQGLDTNYSVDTLMKICLTLGVSPGQLLTAKDYQHLFTLEIQ
jgi:transcriptional regulator with XRE-family HTH domain